VIVIVIVIVWVRVGEIEGRSRGSLRIRCLLYLVEISWNLESFTYLRPFLVLIIGHGTTRELIKVCSLGVYE
jgi:hypothetical protein